MRKDAPRSGGELNPSEQPSKEEYPYLEVLTKAAIAQLLDLDRTRSRELSRRSNPLYEADFLFVGRIPIAHAHANDRHRTRSQVVQIALEREVQIATTLQAMKEGPSVIYQAALSNEHLFGYADFLERREGDSKLGRHYYVPIDVKISSKAGAEYEPSSSVMGRY